MTNLMYVRIVAAEQATWDLAKKDILFGNSMKSSQIDICLPFFLLELFCGLSCVLFQTRVDELGKKNEL